MSRFFTLSFLLRLPVFLLFLLAVPITEQVAQQEPYKTLDKAALVNTDILFTNKEGASESFHAVDSLMERFRKRHKLTGLSVAIAKDGQLQYAQGFGETDAGSGLAVEPYHLFRVASVSKLITAVTLMRLVEQGKLTLDDFVFGRKGILKSYGRPRDWRMRYVRVKHLLEHTSGISQRMGDVMFDPVRIARVMKTEAPASPQVTIAYMLKQRMAFMPGKAYDYSNFGYVVLGEIIEELTGKNYEDVVQEEVLKPAGIRGMGLGKSSRYSRLQHEVAYYPYPRYQKRESIHGTGLLESTAYGGTHLEGLGAAGGWVASPAQLLKLLAVLDRNSDTPDILSVESLRRMVGNKKHRHFGWMNCLPDKRYRTGTLCGTSALLVQQRDGITYSIITNTSTRQAQHFSLAMRREMEKALRHIKHWPAYNLFEMESSIDLDQTEEAMAKQNHGIEDDWE